MDCKNQYYEIITDAWKLLKEHIEEPDWDEIVKISDELDKKYKGTSEYEFARKIIVTVLEEINKKEKAKNEQRG